LVEVETQMLVVLVLLEQRTRVMVEWVVVHPTHSQVVMVASVLPT
jgi:hypothetical protein